jgi:hypothetical protein
MKAGKQWRLLSRASARAACSALAQDGCTSVLEEGRSVQAPGSLKGEGSDDIEPLQEFSPTSLPHLLGRRAPPRGLLYPFTCLRLRLAARRRTERDVILGMRSPISTRSSKPRLIRL